ncbi:hypothetical protein [Lentzea flava]|uniref:Uncharacterized protein n=1 Tax=Lentzea flava TaxID=103732 RepID=A0ABQ2VK02_9PSEU|nr:hypothetical protein [Lentzea flava]MCP2205472.1 hypothetical protein [Lentzea flava]GGU87096.1 hypothetical protein GCM10010178_91200 [Lentzea flava]
MHNGAKLDIVEINGFSLSRVHLVSNVSHCKELFIVLRRIVAGVAFALAMLGGVASATGAAHADSLERQGIPVYAQSCKGAYSMHALAQCRRDGDGRYPCQRYECRSWEQNDTLQLWVGD